MAKLYKEEGVNPAAGCLWGFIQMPIMIALFYAIRQPLSLMMQVAREHWEEGGIIYNKLVELGRTPDLDGFYAEVYIAQDISYYWDSFVGLGVEGLQNISFYLGNINLANIPNWQFIWSESTDWGNPNNWLPALILFLLPFVSGGAQFISAGIMRKMSATGTPEGAGAAAGILKLMPLMSVFFGFMFPAALSFYWTIGTVLQIGQDYWLTKKYTKILDEEDAEKDKLRKVREAELEAKREETERKKADGTIEQNKNTSKRKKKKSNKQDQLEKAADWEKKNAPPEDEKYEPSRVGNRRYARGRAYEPDRYSQSVEEKDAEPKDDEDIIEEEIVEDELDENIGENVEIEDENDDDFDDFDEDEEDDDSEDDDEYEDDEEDDDFEDVDEKNDAEDEDEAPKTTRFETKRFDSNED
jgi:YidC/Oxa1 family membrane protein insertase